MAWEKQVWKGTPWGTRWHNRLAGFPAEGQESWPLFPGRGKQARQITSQLLRLIWVLLSVCWCMALSGWGPSCRDSPTEKKRRNKSLGFSKVHPSGDEDPDPGFRAELGLADGRRDGRRDKKKVTMLEVSPLLSRPPVILALGHGYTLRNFSVCIVPFTGYSEGEKKTSKNWKTKYLFYVATYYSQGCSYFGGRKLFKETWTVSVGELKELRVFVSKQEVGILRTGASVLL